ncbi:CapA family protein [Patescibacteria group bacterium]
MNKNFVFYALLLSCFFLIIFFFYFQFLIKNLITINKSKQSESLNLSSISQITNDVSPLSPTLEQKFNFTLESIFSQNHLHVNRLPKDKTITIITTGDVIPARTVNYKMTSLNNFKYPFEKTANFLQSSDLTLINLEAPLINNCPLTTEGMIFCGDQRFIEGLIFSNINTVNLANNHIFNWGVDGVNQTINLLEKNKILTFGARENQLAVKTIKNTKIGFLGWNLLNNFDQEKIINTIKEAKSNVDLLFVSFHWGKEYVSFPDLWQINLAHLTIEAGADLVLGNHPHWIQPVEIYKEKLIIYAHGNFIFDQEWSKETKIGIVGKHTFYQNRLVDSQFFPIFISDYSQPEILKNQLEEEVLNKLENLSYSLKTSSL